MGNRVCGCINASTIKKNFSSSQATASHIRCQLRDMWVKGTPQNREFVKLFYYQQQLGLAIASPISKKQVISATSCSTNAYQLPKGGVKNFERLAARPSSQASSNRRPHTLTNPFRFCDQMILSRISDHLTEKKKKAISHIPASAMDQVHSFISTCTFQIFFLHH